MNNRTRSGACGCARGAIERRTFLTTLGAGAAAMWGSWPMPALAALQGPRRNLQHARVRAAFLYPDSKTFSEDPDGWWSWPGNDYDAEQRQQKYMAAFKEMESNLGMRVETDNTSIATPEDTSRLVKELEKNPPDGLLLVMFYNVSLKHADALIAAAEKLGIPVIFYIGLGVKHGPITQYRRPGLYFIQSLDNLDAIEYGLRMIDTKKLLAQKRLLSITEADEVREGTEGFFGIGVRVIPFRQYAEEFGNATIDTSTRAWLKDLATNATELRGVSTEALDNAAHAHLALTKMMADEDADGVTMNCLRRGMLKPCISFATLNSQLAPAACENDLPAAYSQLIGQMLLERPGFQHNPAFETERNHYYASHCTCAKDMHGPEGEAVPYRLRRFAHTNEGSCAIQVFWKPGEPVTMMRYHPGENPTMDVYAGRVAQSHEMPPVGGCTTNVEIELTDRRDACMVKGHHNLLFCGDYARKFRLFANLCKLPLAQTGYEGSVY